MAKIKIVPQADRKYTVECKRTRAFEGRSKVQRDVPETELESTVARMLSEIRGEV